MTVTRQIKLTSSDNSFPRRKTGAEKSVRRISMLRLALLLLTAFCMVLTSSCSPTDTPTPSDSGDTTSPSASNGTDPSNGPPAPDMSKIKVPGILPDDELLIDIDVMDLVFYSQFTQRKKFEFVFVSSKPVKADDLIVELSGTSVESYVPKMQLIEIIEKDNGFPYHLFQTYQGMDWNEYSRLFNLYLDYFESWNYSLLPEKRAFEEFDNKDYPAYLKFIENGPPTYHQYFAYVDLKPLFEGDRTGSVEFNRMTVRFGDKTYRFDVRVKIDYDREPPQSLSKYGSFLLRETILEPFALAYSEDGAFLSGYADMMIDSTKVPPLIEYDIFGERYEMSPLLRLHMKDVQLIDNEAATLRGIRLNDVSLYYSSDGRRCAWRYDRDVFYDGLKSNYWNLQGSASQQVGLYLSGHSRKRFHFDIMDPRYQGKSAFIAKYYATIYYDEIDPETSFLVEDLYDYCEINVMTRRNVHEIVAERLDGIDVKARYFSDLYTGSRGDSR